MLRIGLPLSILTTSSALAVTPIAGRPTSAQDMELAGLEAQVQAEVAVELNGSGSLHYLATTDIVPGCSAPRTASQQDAEALLACFFQRYPALFSEGAEDTRAVPRAPVSIGSPSADGFQVVRLHQLYGQLRVRGSEVVVVLNNGTLGSFIGRLFPPSRVPPPRRCLTRARSSPPRSSRPLLS